MWQGSRRCISHVISMSCVAKQLVQFEGGLEKELPLLHFLKFMKIDF
jgi:hypothetical protein